MGTREGGREGIPHGLGFLFSLWFVNQWMLTAREALTDGVGRDVLGCSVLDVCVRVPVLCARCKASLSFTGRGLRGKTGAVLLPGAAIPGRGMGQLEQHPPCGSRGWGRPQSSREGGQGCTNSPTTANIGVFCSQCRKPLALCVCSAATGLFFVERRAERAAGSPRALHCLDSQAETQLEPAARIKRAAPASEFQCCRVSAALGLW